MTDLMKLKIRLEFYEIPLILSNLANVVLS